jgi:hypothetical protein
LSLAVNNYKKEEKKKKKRREESLKRSLLIHTFLTFACFFLVVLFF